MAELGGWWQVQQMRAVALALAPASAPSAAVRCRPHGASSCPDSSLRNEAVGSSETPERSQNSKLPVWFQSFGL